MQSCLERIVLSVLPCLVGQMMQGSGNGNTSNIKKLKFAHTYIYHTYARHTHTHTHTHMFWGVRDTHIHKYLRPDLVFLGICLMVWPDPKSQAADPNSRAAGSGA